MSRTKELARLESLGESEVRYQLAQFSYSGSLQLTEEWLRQNEAARLTAMEVETLATARETAIAASRAASAAERSASAAFEQARWAKWAAAIAATAAIVSARDEIVQVIKSLI